MSATLRRPASFTGSRRVTVQARGRPVNWSNKATPAQWRAKRRQPRSRIRR